MIQVTADHPNSPDNSDVAPTTGPDGNWHFIVAVSQSNSFNGTNTYYDTIQEPFTLKVINVPPVFNNVTSTTTVTLTEDVTYTAGGLTTTIATENLVAPQTGVVFSFLDWSGPTITVNGISHPAMYGSDGQLHEIDITGDSLQTATITVDGSTFTPGNLAVGNYTLHV